MTGSRREPTKSEALGLNVFRTDDLNRRPFWLPTSGTHAAAWLHHPAGGQGRLNGVVVCPPMGYEYAHSHRSLLQLADQLATRGFVVVRLDYPGTGNSPGDATTANLPDLWLQAIADALDLVHELTGGSPMLVGVRLGALLAGLAASRRDVRGLVCWAPVVNGRRVVREIKALQSVGADSETVEGFLEGAGFRLSSESADALAGFDLLASKPRVDGGILIVDRDDQRTPPSLVKHLMAERFDVSVVTQVDFPEMVAEPQYSVVPSQTLDAISGWLTDLAASGLAPLSGPGWSKVRTWPAGVVTPLPPPSSTEVEEVLLQLPRPDGGTLFGVLCRPSRIEEGPLVVLPNSGSVHQVGPHRLYVELARSLAEAGLLSFRFDLRNLGDSGFAGCDEENHPYPSTATRDVAAIVGALWARLGTDRFAICGLCSGAHTAFHVGHEVLDDRIESVVCINPLTFRFKDGMSLDTPESAQSAVDAKYYGQAMFDPSRWLRLLKGESDLPYIGRFLLKRLAERLKHTTYAVLRTVGLRSASQLENHLTATSRLGRSVSFVFSDTDPGLETLTREAGAALRRLRGRGQLTTSVVPGADHTFSRSKARRIAISNVVGALTSNRHRVRDDKMRASVRRIDVPVGQAIWPAVRSAWRQLLAQTNETSAFLSETWVRLWLERFGPTGKASAVIWTEPSGQPIGCAILSSQQGRIGPAKVSRSFLNASGVEGVGCEHNDFLALPSHRPQLIVDLCEMLRARNDDEIALEGVRSDLFDELRETWWTRSWEGYRSEAPFVALGKIREAGATYLSTLSSNTRSQIRRSKRLYESKYGPLHFGLAESADEATDWFSELLRLHDARWRFDTGESGFTQEARGFHQELIARATRPETDLDIDMVRLRFGTETIAILYHIVWRGHVCFFQSGISYDDDRRLKPGLLAHALSIQHSLDRGDHTYDFLGGEPEPVQYKRSLATDLRHLYWAQLPANKPRLSALRQLRILRRRLRGWGPRASRGGPEPNEPR